ncbi:hypothetical protein COCNU_14G002480 [Cocos nucifera]|uniref:Uncharacterized protein n=1 Tax=Cocos nucifera TaxID=13894 RepID=A0A8K0NCN3_COCNU|nr:hypothetical protein COCNU_14G002480 [Cocos nucifera]
MSVERSLEAWEEVQRHGQDLADRLAQGLTGLIQSHISPPAFSWPSPLKKPFDLDLPAFHVPGQPDLAAGGVSTILDIGGRLGQAGAEFGACLNGVVQQFFRQLPVPFRQDEGRAVAAVLPAAERRGGGGKVLGLAMERFGDQSFSDVAAAGSSDELGDEEGLGFDAKASAHLKRPRGIINITSTYDCRTHDMESSLVARGDLWRVEASQGGSTSGNESSPLFLIQLGPVLFVRDTTLLLPVHLSKQHLLWYGYDRKSFMDLQFPNGQLTYMAGEGFTSSAFLPVFGGLLQAQGRYPGETRISFSCKVSHRFRKSMYLINGDRLDSEREGKSEGWNAEVVSEDRYFVKLKFAFHKMLNKSDNLILTWIDHGPEVHMPHFWWKQSWDSCRAYPFNQGGTQFDLWMFLHSASFCFCLLISGEIEVEWACRELRSSCQSGDASQQHWQAIFVGSVKQWFRVLTLHTKYGYKCTYHQALTSRSVNILLYPNV